jgi:hypothetical protein
MKFLLGTNGGIRNLFLSRHQLFLFLFFVSYNNLYITFVGLKKTLMLEITFEDISSTVLYIESEVV